MTEHHATAENQGEAMDWLAGRLRWERILRELHDRAEDAAKPAAAATGPEQTDDRAA